jgi:hypothetical protein
MAHDNVDAGIPARAKVSGDRRQARPFLVEPTGGANSSSAASTWTLSGTRRLLDRTPGPWDRDGPHFLYQGTSA